MCKMWLSIRLERKKPPLPYILMSSFMLAMVSSLFFQAEDGIRDLTVTGVQTCALPIFYQPHGRLPVKGKVEPILAFRAVRPRSAIPRQSRGVGDLRAPLVGRERELRLLLDVFGRVAEDRQTHLFTMVGNAGIGKSRLVEEALARMATEFRPRILQGHCLPYGEGITYWPVIEILREDAGITMEDDRETAIRKLDNRLASIGQVSEDQSVLARRLIVVLGLEPADTAIPEVPAAEVVTRFAGSP